MCKLTSILTGLFKSWGVRGGKLKLGRGEIPVCILGTGTKHVRSALIKAGITFHK